MADGSMDAAREIEEQAPRSPRPPRRRELLPPDVYPSEPFALVERRFQPALLAHAETLFAVSNGFLGIRGTPEEGAPVYRPGMVLNGFHETWPIIYGEEAYGFAKLGQTLLPVPDASLIRLFVDDDAVDLAQVHLLSFERRMDQRAGLLSREVLFETYDGRRVRVRSTRMASLEHRHLACFEYEVTPLDAGMNLTIASELSPHERGDHRGTDPRLGPGLDEESLVPEGEQAEGTRIVRCFRTRSSGLRLACGIEHEITAPCPVTSRPVIEGHDARVVITAEAGRGQSVRVVKYAAYHYAGGVAADEMRFRVGSTLHAACDAGIADLQATQRRLVGEFWDAADVRVDGDEGVQQALRHNLFQVLQASARCEGHGIAAKGLTGEGYEGHYFWDTDVYVMPMLVYTRPHTARNLLRFRYDMLEQARERARELGHRGVLFPWRTINGHEASAQWAAGTAQYHINADIIHALRTYTQATGDVEFMFRYGAEMVVETARLWADLGFFSDTKDGQFVINKVTGPDEYTTVVENNAFTNLMAKENLLYAVDVVEWLRRDRPLEYRRLVRTTGLDESEPEEWLRAGHLMYVPYDEQAGVHLQDEDFLQMEPWDFAGTPPEKYPLLLHFHPLTIYRHQVIKQADVVMAAFLLGHRFTREEKRRIFDYYDPITTMDSSLSAPVQSIVANQVGHRRTAYEYFMDALLVDLGDVSGNVEDGAHLAALAGSWMAVVYGFAGLQDFDGRLRFDPRLAEGWTRLRFALMVRGRRLELDVVPGATTYTLSGGEGLAITHRGRHVGLTPGVPRTLEDETG